MPPKFSGAKGRSSLKGGTNASLGWNSPSRQPRHNVLTPGLVSKAQQTFDLYEPHPMYGLSVASVQQCLNDMGILVSENQAKDMIFGLKQSSVIETKNQQVDAQIVSEELEALKATQQELLTSRTMSPGGVSARGDVRDGGSVTGSIRGGGAVDAMEASRRTNVPLTPMGVTRTASLLRVAQGGSDGAGTTSVAEAAELYLSFSLFLDLIVMTLDDSDRDRELQSTWNIIDQDKDGQLGLKDIQALFAKYGSVGEGSGGGGGGFGGTTTSPTSGGAQAAPMGISVAEIQALVLDLDMNSDGIITLEDLKTALETQ